jgi:hypothetical protein
MTIKIINAENKIDAEIKKLKDKIEKIEDKGWVLTPCGGDVDFHLSVKDENKLRDLNNKIAQLEKKKLSNTGTIVRRRSK